MDGVEEQLIVEALAETLYLRLTASDRVLFESLVESAFPQNEVDWSGIGERAETKDNGKERVRYEAELRHLRAMGFEDVRKCQSVLRKHHGDAELALQELFDSII